MLNDLRALGWWTPLRVLYELGRCSGTTGRLLLWLAGRRRTIPPIRSVAPRWAPGPAEADWSPWANEILAGRLEIFGREVTIEPSTEWHADERGGTWPRIPWWRIDLYGAAGRDVKHTWELARHHHLVVLARAAAGSGESKYQEALARHLGDWINQNPPEIGVHWYSNLEIALRSLAWIEILWLVGSDLPSALRSRMERYLYHSGTHIVAGLSHTLASARNNHLIGDAVGLMVIGTAFSSDRRARRWARLGSRMLSRHLPHHVAADGSTIEDSLGYRAFVTQLLAVAACVESDPEPTRAVLERMAGHLRRIGVGESVVPRFGDWDGGSAVPDLPRSVSPLSALSAAARVGAQASGAAPVDDGSDSGGGLGRIRRGPWLVYLKAGTGTSHEHADLLSVAIAHDGDWVVGDPANGSYNRSLESRDYFRTSAAHSVLRVEGIDQREPHRRFRWRYHPAALLGDPFDAGAYRVMWGIHAAYERLDPPVHVMRTCLVGPSSIIVADWTQPVLVTGELSLPLHPDVDYGPDPGSPDRGALLLPGGASLGLRLPGPAEATRGSKDPFAGWWADDYDVVRPATLLTASTGEHGPVVWSLWLDTPPEVTMHADALVGPGWRLVARRDVDGRLVPSLEER